MPNRAARRHPPKMPALRAHEWSLFFQVRLTPEQARQVVMAKTGEGPDAEAAQRASGKLVADRLQAGEVDVHGPGCYTCEQEWEPDVAALPCPGEPARA